MLSIVMKVSGLKKSLIRKKRKNESRFKYIMGLIHLWLGLLSSVVIIVVCLSGCIYAFKNQITDLLNKDKVFVKESKGEKMSAEYIQKKLNDEVKTLTSITIPVDKSRSYVVSYSQNSLDKAVYINPYSGKDLGTADVSMSRFFEVILDIHRNLMMGNVGRQINGVAVLMFCVLLFSGFVLWIPQKLKLLKQALTIKWSGKFQRLNYDLHNTLGFYTFLILFFMAVTGLYITYPWVKNMLIVSLGGDSISNISGVDSKEDSDAFDSIFNDMLSRQKEKSQLKEEKIVSLQEILDKSDKILPYNAVTTLELPNKENPRFVVTKINTDNWLGAMLPDEITFDKKGNFKSKELFSEKPLNKQFTSLAKPLHTGEILGLKSVILYFIVCLIGFSLPITGFIFWFHRFRKIKG
ncbi:PepSY-associated TM helix domain-containing protein [Chryseobacterium oryctis]|uniref:PepSY domain-containing protein n=1 Tax=Chryseobacterium oryctis TaxID=2952618 RepID=A0ABT3HQP2_9FLAO|nr:PepSY-associated TM helix domain-containing protein [Chryseobacterium oryctis]MCW3162095.1 PepSY domain-containing protein [Chryseobacterium oryctis]